MAGKIIILPDDLIGKIAAGEVIERPSSVVKELLENALDAGATEVTVELRRGGKDGIRVIDNGDGMDIGDVPLAFERHATSKIAAFDDLYQIRSFGFRGEALPSITAVARVELLTRQKGSLSGVRAVVEAGSVREVEEAGCPAGTSVAVSRLFDNVPVRKKFLKKDLTEQGHCLDVITRTAMPHSGVRFRVIANGRETLTIPGTEDLAERITLLLGYDAKSSMIPVYREGTEGRVSGFITGPEFARSNSRSLFFYVNGRYVRDALLNQAVLSAYRNLMEAKKYPPVVLFLDVEPEGVDVNVHPAKLEVRFRNPSALFDLVAGSVAEALSLKKIPASTTSFGVGAEEPPGHAMEARYRAGVSEALKRYSVASGTQRRLFQELSGIRAQREELDRQRPEMLSLPERVDDVDSLPFSSLHYMGQLGGTYLVFSSSCGLILIDQHAAHERVLFDKLKATAFEQGIEIQTLLIPETVDLTPGEFSAIQESQQILNASGIEVEPFGGQTVLVKSVPALLSHVEPKALIRDLFAEMSEFGRTGAVSEVREKIFAFLACRGAVKANHLLSESEVSRLCRELDSTAFSSNCPHGRPVFLRFSFHDLERMFGRK